jgi:predicted anti-sigma-YlaC factor YlaD
MPTTMHCKTIRRQLIDFTEGDPEPAVKHAMEAHLKGCSDCRHYADLLKGVFATVENEKDVAFDPFMVTRVMHAVESKKKSRVRLSLQRSLQPVLIILVLAFLILAGINLGKRYGYRQILADDYKTELFYLGTLQDESLESILLSE